MPLTREITRSEALRYLGLGRSGTLDEEGLRLFDTCKAKLEESSVPRSVTKEVSVNVTDDMVMLGDTGIKSTGLARNLKCCTKAVLVAVTIGPACDRLVKRAQIKSNLEAAIYQALGAAAVEDYIDSVNDEIKERYKAQGLYCRPRFSPGYGDLSLEHQKDWFRMLDITRNTGITLLDSLLMVPTKSVTAVIGLGTDKTGSFKHDCSNCNISDTCSFAAERT